MGKIKCFGVVDEEPYDVDTWSGSSYYFFNSISKYFDLLGATSSDPKGFIKNILIAKNFNININKWKFKYHLDTSVADYRTKFVKYKYLELINKTDVILQIGAWYNFNNIGKYNISYHDGNLAVRTKSPFGFPKISKKFLNKAFEYEKKLYKEMDIIFPMSRWLAESFIKDFGVDEYKVVPVFAGINMGDVHLYEKNNFDKKRILFIGCDFERKGGKVLLDAFKYIKKEIPECTLDIVGPNVKIDIDGVKVHGFIRKDEQGMALIKGLYREASIFVMPSLYEPFGIVFAEAMAHGLPCVGVDNCAIPEIVLDGKTGFLAKIGDSMDLADKIIYLLKDVMLMKEMGEKGFNHYYDNMRWEVVAKKIYRQCLTCA